MSLSRYPEYKSAGIEWLPKVPSHWTVKRVRHAAYLNPSKRETQHLPRDLRVDFLPMEAVGTDGRISREQKKPIEQVIDGFTYFREGDVAFAKITPCFENGKCAVMRNLSEGVGFGTTELTVLRPKPDQAISEYLYYLLSSEPFNALGESEMYGAGGQKRVPDYFARNFRIAFPPVIEQTQIAAFLNHETTKIDTLIEEQQRLIELLKEKRQAVISHAVTKGLDPDAPMKDSGVEWLGEVPAHWSVSALRHFAQIRGGIAIGKRYSNSEQLTEAPYLRVANVQDAYIDLADLKTIRVSRSELDRYSLREGDVLMNEGGDNDKLGRGTVWDAPIERCLHQNHVFAIRCDDRLIPEWLALFSRSASARAYFYLYSKQSTNLASISSSNVMSCILPVPPITEQKRILNQVSKSLNEIQELNDAADRAVRLLQERRSALISAAVTGKIDVRNWRPESETAEKLPMAAEQHATYETRES